MTSFHRVGYVGNFRPAHSTENHISAALRAHGHMVVPFQEDTIDWQQLGALAADAGCDWVMWTRTWHLPSHNGTQWATQLDALDDLRRRGIPTVGYHLDRWWGLDREHQIRDEPFFRVDLMVTADGGHDDDWVAAGVNHRWMPPAVWGREAAQPGVPRPEFARDVVFVGSWQRYHPEWGYRLKLTRWLTAEYGRHGKLGIWPQGKAVRGQDLADLYVSAGVVIGDSCLAPARDGRPIRRYWSDRIPETLGRGGFLIHPMVEGLDEHYQPDEHLVTYEITNPETPDFGTLRNLITGYLLDPAERARVATAGRAHVLEHHTYEVRMGQLVKLLYAEGLVSPPDQRSGLVAETDRAGVARARFDLRAGTDDACVVNEIWRENTYEIPPGALRGKVVVDAGANIGAFATWAVAAGAEHVFAVEPDPVNVERLRRHLLLNAIDHKVTVVQAAIVGPDGPDLVGFTLAGASGHIARPDEISAAGLAAWQTETIGLAELLERADQWGAQGFPLVLKLDIEGGEFDALDGIPLAALHRVERIVMEFHGQLNGRPETTAAEFAAMFSVLADWGQMEVIGRPTDGGVIRGVRW